MEAILSAITDEDVLVGKTIRSFLGLNKTINIASAGGES